MEDQGKRLLIAVALAFGLMMIYSNFFAPKPEEKPKDAATTAQTAQPPGNGEVPPPPTAPTTAPAPDMAPPPPGSATDAAPAAAVTAPARGEEQITTLESDGIRAEFSNYSGALKSWELVGHTYRDEAGKGINLVPLGADEKYRSFLFGFHPSSTVALPMGAEWKGEKVSESSVKYTYATDELKVIKTYKLNAADYLLEVTVDVVKLAGAEAQIAPLITFHGYQDPKTETSSSFTTVANKWEAACMLGSSIGHSSAGGLAKNSKLRTGRVRWAGFVHSYFLSGVAPKGIDPQMQVQCNAYGVPALGDKGGMRMDIVFPTVTLRAGDPPLTREFVAYMGPKLLDKLEGIPRVVGFEPGFSQTIDLGWFSVIARPLLWIMQWFHSFLGNWGLSIIFLTILVKLATLYWTTKSMRSMKSMQKLRPKMEALQKKYKDDKQRLQVETMNLYKAHGVNPLAGCLPMLLQMPIWFALYRMLGAAAELYHAPFIPGWINDLTATDPYYVLPVAVMGMMFLQAKLSPSPVDSTQQKIMVYGLPLVFGFFSFFFPAGLTLYIFTNTTLTAVHSVWMNRTDDKSDPMPIKKTAESDAEVEVLPAPKTNAGGAKKGGPSGRKRGKKA